MGKHAGKAAPERKPGSIGQEDPQNQLEREEAYPLDVSMARAIADAEHIDANFDRAARKNPS
jgi:hypothetical protein